MKSIKPGRGPSMMSGIAGIGAVAFGSILDHHGCADGRADFFAAFGIIFIVMAIVGVIYNMHNATGEKRYAAFDIVDEGEEADPLNERYGWSAKTDSADRTENAESRTQESGVRTAPQGKTIFARIAARQ